MLVAAPPDPAPAAAPAESPPAAAPVAPATVPAGIVGGFARAAHLLAALFVASLLIVPAAYTVTSAAACAAALVAGAPGWRGRAGRVFGAMAVFVVPCLVFLAVVLVAILTGDPKNQYKTHLLIALLTLWVGLSGVPAMLPDVRRWFLPAAALGALASLVLAGWQVVVEGHVRAMGLLGWGQNWSGSVKFGAMAAVQGLLALVLFIRTDRGWRHWLGLAGFLASAGTLGFAQARGGLLGYLLGMIALAWVSRRALLSRRGRVDPPTRRRTTLHIALVGLTALTLAAVSMQSRLADIGPQLERYERGDAASEVGQRLALWHASLLAIRHAPWTGSGFGRFPREIERQRTAGEIPPGIQLIYGQTHNEYLAAFVDGGIVAGVAATAMFVLPVLLLLRRLSRQPEDGPAAHAALAVAVAFAGFALTDNLFDRQLTVISFYFLMCWLLSAAAPRASPPARATPVAPVASGAPGAPGA